MITPKNHRSPLRKSSEAGRVGGRMQTRTNRFAMVCPRHTGYIKKASKVDNHRTTTASLMGQLQIAFCLNVVRWRLWHYLWVGMLAFLEVTEVDVVEKSFETSIQTLETHFFILPHAIFTLVKVAFTNNCKCNSALSHPDNDK
ncbi:unnamed protein product [Hydatigera taeniaeformis]|uniref:Uncharacterized protein n=1 Tax=Hydatigena taeniaeformis TaxID=6205 RepID=A0A0R3WN91_HYDTA|nr:unnamed protein product [Hydatigera taeniaeformis]